MHKHIYLYIVFHHISILHLSTLSSFDEDLEPFQNFIIINNDALNMLVRVSLSIYSLEYISMGFLEHKILHMNR